MIKPSYNTFVKHCNTSGTHVNPLDTQKKPLEPKNMCRCVVKKVEAEETFYLQG